jgi:hypothetical protein
VVLALAAVSGAAQIDVTVTNQAGGIYFTPLLVAAHDSSTHLFEVGTAASDDLSLMAQCGDVSALVSLASLSGADTVVNLAAGLLEPGDSATAALDTDVSGNTHLSIVAMMLPTNDGFIGLDALELPAAMGTYTYFLFGYDAGTEANNELISSEACAVGVDGIPNPIGITDVNGTGVAGTDTNTSVHIHRGTLGDTDPSGGTSDLDSTAHRWLNPVARVVLSVQ